MTLGLSLGIVVGYLVVALGLGLVAYRVSETTAEDYYLANRSIGTLVLLFTTFATLLSAFTFFGGPNLAYAAGPEWLIVMGTLDGVLFAVLWYVIGYKQWLIGARNGYVTLGEMLGDRFGSTGLRALVAGVSLLWLFPYVMLQQMGAGEALVGLTGGAVPYWGGAALITGFMILYVAVAGLRGVAWTDTLQGLFMLSVVWIAAAWVVSSLGGVGAATEGMLAARPEFGSFGGGTYTPGFIVSTAITIAFGVTMFPQINQRFFVAKSATTLKRSFALWPVLVLLLFLPAFMLGAWAAGTPIEVPDGANVLPVILGEYAPAWFTALVVAGAMAAMMSSSDSMLLSGSSYFTRDLYRPLIDANASERREAWIARIGVAAFATLSFVASLFRPGTLIEVGDTAFSGFALLALPVICALYWPRTTRTGMIAGVAVPQVAYLAVVLSAVVGAVPTLPRTVFGGWDVALGLMVLSGALTVGVSLLTAATDEGDASRFAVAGD
ncbi:sodium:solute symporter family protein [Halorubrum sp. GN11_10-6_MGM]|uniref:sodium:solute symporter family protein n=1 Tax=Halorubrum sp. GN11_10-6_MGM TaxID=2518112 RepID=UPI0010F90D06|nr:sodium:solute symporter family protein [Halorubrum sp. GN11_10-6_MGM]TKX75755.1 sodium:solute symporter family protein [Halorubrum sp. GN11_10-6_MGM]